ncbi:D-alanyl-D-alanine carboxypeptidase/D-alanyl-D-alanine-endopeptidase [Anaerobacillus sp. 1_MG-2023]|uniref:D-alanyl-D-alanine carboxypeptidase/D-alanyl-D-alanine endopeptidase n=1 Tax=Anaerobacillus sp. 1_MG-2023 TaxID=3062655 RepID=UPI0026E445DB|nr:D-alanyl-D-alanine carboxypeptidase/D-alanyl-D-alanine-endopeptidase [Anaerobacillus sp. 1_MG-2023]MDO6654783.1 D-alanyl-D-alanine carboxypeptidase/D-alanyl-D-alanine-endopeptidase [Anaerobacillus sp. 1_MG-2023]
MKQTLKSCLIITLLFLLIFPPLTSHQDASADKTNSTLSTELNEILSNQLLDGAIAGISVRAASTGELIYENYGETRLTPASNMKLFTAGAALETLGPDYRFSTELLTDGKLKNNNLKGNIYLKGKGDPTLLKEDFDELAHSLKEKGVHKIQGNLIGDNSWYDEEALSQDMVWSDEDNYYGAKVSALTASPNEDYDAGTIIVEVYPGKQPGDQANVQLSPSSDVLKVENRAITVKADKEAELTISREHGSNTILVEGEISEDVSRKREWIAVWDPPQYALSLMHQSLKEAGIKFKGDIQQSKTPEDATLLIEKKSMSLSELLIPFMKLSNNGHAEILVKEMGKVKKDEGSWEAGLEVVTDFLQKQGLHTDDMRLRDGSGISHVTLVKPNQLSEFLFNIQNESWFDPFYRSLPIAGDSDRSEGGTLRYRMRDTAAEQIVHAKTGSLTGVSSLSGYVEKGNGLVFSILLNQFVEEDGIKDIEDEIAIVLAEYSTEGKE